jgi:hypothetical protein
MLRHYLEVKARHPDAILLYRMGDFFETFFQDAEIAAPIFEVQLTARQRGSPSEAPMCGVPYHAVEGYIGKLLRAGLKVAVCDQVEDPAKAKGLVRREVTRVVTPGTVSELALLDSREANYLACVLWRDGRGAAAFLEVTTGAFFVRRYEDATDAAEDLARYRPSEVPRSCTPKAALIRRSSASSRARWRAGHPSPGASSSRAIWPPPACAAGWGPLPCGSSASIRKSSRYVPPRARSDTPRTRCARIFRTYATSKCEAGTTHWCWTKPVSATSRCSATNATRAGWGHCSTRSIARLPPPERAC